MSKHIRPGIGKTQLLERYVWWQLKAGLAFHFGRSTQKDHNLRGHTRNKFGLLRWHSARQCVQLPVAPALPLLSPQEEPREFLLLCKLPLPKKIPLPIPHSSLPSPSPLRPDPPADWLPGAERGRLLPAHEHARRNRSRRGPAAPTGTGDPARTSH